MRNKAAAAYYGVPCSGSCCAHNRHVGTCYHLRVCKFHLDQKAAEDEKDRRYWEAKEAARIARAKSNREGRA